MRLLVSGLAGGAILILGLGITAGFAIADGASVVGSVLAAAVTAGAVALAWPRVERKIPGLAHL
jgi:hypothetical protein